jgi:cation diffusion facilitator family transporter
VAVSASGGTKAVLAALVANLGIAVSKFVAFLITSSSSMLAEAIHSLADSGNQVLLLVGNRRSQRRATEEHPFGYGRERYIYAFIVAIVLFTVGGLFAVYEGIEKIRHPHEVESAFVAIAVLVVAIGLESFSLRTAVQESNHVRHGAPWVQFIRHSRSPELPVVLLEDIGALLGLVFALLGVTLTVLTDDTVWDGIGTLTIGVLLVCIAVVLALETKSMLLGESAAPGEIAKIRSVLEGTPGVRRLIHLRTLHLGPDELLVAAKIEIDHDATVPEVAQAIDAAEARVREVVPTARVMYLEPDLYREPAAPAGRKVT